MVTQPARDRLGRIARARRNQLGLSQDAVGRKGGPQMSTVSQIERGLDRSFSTKSYRRLENALQWEPGTVQTILTGRLSSDAERRLIIGPIGVSASTVDQDDAQLLARISDAVLVEELYRRLSQSRG